jgi:aspartate/methionine/tyrosine aminotransferase
LANRSSRLELQVYDNRRKLMVKLMRGVGFGIPIMPQGAFYVFADASGRTDDSYGFAFDLFDLACVAVAPGVDFGQAGTRSVRFSYASSKENKPNSWHDPAPTSSHQSPQVRFRCSVSVNARRLRS